MKYGSMRKGKREYNSSLGLNETFFFLDVGEILLIEMNPWIRIMRPFNCFLISMCAIVGWIADKGTDAFTVHWPALILTFIGGWALSAAAMILNDYFDIEIDKINQPTRPIPSGEIKPKVALTVGIILVIIGIIMGLSIDLFEYLTGRSSVFGIALVTAVINSALLLSYTKILKKYSLLGNLGVSIGVWFGFMYGDLIVDFTFSWFPETLGFAAFILNFGREIAKGIIDIEGDRENNVTTIATAFGKKWTAVISAAFFLMAAGSTVIPILLAGASWVYAASISVAVVLAITVSVWILIDQSDKSIKVIKTIVLYTMLLALVAFTLEALFRNIVPPLLS